MYCDASDEALVLSLQQLLVTRREGLQAKDEHLEQEDLCRPALNCRGCAVADAVLDDGVELLQVDSNVKDGEEVEAGDSYIEVECIVCCQYLRVN
eukprot:1595232-Rhodomonas_salina.1